MNRTILRTGMVLAIGATVSACGTTYNLPEVTDGSVSEAARMFQEEREDGVSRARSSPDQAARTFVEVARRVEPIAERFCEEQTAEIADFNCDVQIVLDDQMPYRNAYQTYAGDGTPIVAFTLPMVADARNRAAVVARAALCSRSRAGLVLCGPMGHARVQGHLIASVLPFDNPDKTFTPASFSTRGRYTFQCTSRVRPGGGGGFPLRVFARAGHGQRQPQGRAF
jgi:hypothetical protein